MGFTYISGQLLVQKSHLLYTNVQMPFLPAVFVVHSDGLS